MGPLPFHASPYPNYYRRPYSYRPISNINENTNNFIDKNATNADIKNSVESSAKTTDTRTLAGNRQKEKIPPKRNSFANFNISNLFSSNLDEPVLEILGISLFLDDILIIGLLFFLYTEGVKDELLFICLILLLLG